MRNKYIRIIRCAHDLAYYTLNILVILIYHISAVVIDNALVMVIFACHLTPFSIVRVNQEGTKQRAKKDVNNIIARMRKYF